MTSELLDWDRQHLWHPYTSMSDPAPVRLVTGASGVRLELADGSTPVDAMASWWSAIHGYNHPALNAAARDQLDDMAHVMFGGLTHEPAIRLGQRLVELAPEGLEHVFFADSGSVSVEVALKMALQHQRGAGRPGRTRMLTVLGGYHGDTCGCMGVCDPEGGMHSMFRGFVPEHVFAPRPPRLGEDTTEWAAAFEALAEQYADELAAIIVEPLLQGAGGMWPYPAECLRVMRSVADRHDLLLILDEIATGFGRTGTMFAADAAGVRPDIMCVGKALTGGYLTLAAVLCTSGVAHGLSRSEAGVLMHGPTYMANPLACSVALASLDLLTTTDWAANIDRISRRLTPRLEAARGLSGVADVRVLGAVGVIQLDHSVDVVAATDAALRAGVWLRPFRDLIYTMPPYTCTDAEIDTICSAMLQAVEAG
ncbi:MAG: bioA [Nocardioides sp.]|jgi:adenosylmethionine-8-amino-7-oxononanoate aminotransferase|uniref:adenosylmethionine--8-amino-7-oxononanoate transaminase n=1 Tax=Nocardioides sp. TaxID=35761 RepID=UPI00261DA2FD|nr:adenosylmethionine--8-amino-7-oxononanoate transaminase [Nocardioides sp.]MCW2834072.1 bioA [Nocardioides sp.]